MKRSIKNILLCSMVAAFVVSGCSKGTTEKKEETKKEEKIELISNSLYVEPKDPTTVQIKAFNKLSKAVEAQNEEEEAKMAAVGFALDFFTLSNKTGNDDVGGLAFVPTTKVFRFKEYAQAYYYSNYGTIKNEYGEDSLPNVKSYKVKSVELVDTTYNDKPCQGYAVTVTLSYEDSEVEKENLKTKATITVVGVSDFPYDRAKEYVNETDFTGDKINAYRVVSLE